MIQSDGVRAAAAREVELHPTTPAGKAITAWDRRANTIEELVGAVNALDGIGADVAELKTELNRRPF